MTNKKIRQLANLSYLKYKLDEKKVKKISYNLSRKDLKEYIKILKMLEKKKSVTVVLPSTVNDRELENNLREIFRGKKIIYKVDKDIIAGIKILDQDNVYDFSLTNKLDSIIANIN